MSRQMTDAFREAADHYTALNDEYIAEVTRLREALAMAGHRTPDEHDCFLMNCRLLGFDVYRLTQQLAARSQLREAERFAAEAILDRPYADPDDDAAIVARAVLRLAAARSQPATEELREAAKRIAGLSEDDIRDYEQGLCFFCGGGHEPVPGPRGGITGDRQRRPIHEPTCSYLALRAALAMGGTE